MTCEDMTYGLQMINSAEKRGADKIRESNNTIGD